MITLYDKVRSIISKSKVFFKKSGNKEVRYFVTTFNEEKINFRFNSGRTVKIGLQTFINCINKNIFYIKSIKIEAECSCGAAHTSNPNYHLSYCDRSKII